MADRRVERGTRWRRPDESPADAARDTPGAEAGVNPKQSKLLDLQRSAGNAAVEWGVQRWAGKGAEEEDGSVADAGSLKALKANEQGDMLGDAGSLKALKANEPQEFKAASTQNDALTDASSLKGLKANGQNDALTDASSLKGLKGKDEKAAPPQVRVTWGNKGSRFTGPASNIGTKYTMFSPEGTPSRATAGLKMKEASSLTSKSASESGSTSKSSEGSGPASTTSDKQDEPEDPKAKWRR